MRESVDQCAAWAGQPAEGLFSWVPESASSYTGAAAAAPVADERNPSLPAPRSCAAPLADVLARRLRRVLEQPLRINLLLTQLYATLLEVPHEPLQGFLLGAAPNSLWTSLDLVRRGEMAK